MTTLAELIAQYCAHLGDDYPAIAARLNAPTEIANPQTEPATVPHPPSLVEVLAIVPSAERVAIRSELPGYVDDVRRTLDEGNPVYMATLIEDALTAGAISQQTAAALAALAQRTQADPSWTATIAGPSLASAAGLGAVTSAQVQAVMNS